ncbi:kinase-like domain-containing protein [Desarmillaria ectypa]|nr:kinase-like domain-containing protein [Desarmillaria ectypa]
MAPARTTKRSTSSVPYPEPSRKRRCTDQKSVRLVDVFCAMDRFKQYYSVEPEYKSAPPPTLRIPRTRRPSPLYINDVLYIKTIGYGSTCTVGVVKSTRREEPLDKPGSLFAVKIVRKVVMRINEDGPNIGDQYNAKNVERTCLGSLPWNPFIAGLITTDTDDFNFYTLLEYFAGGSLEDVLDNVGPQSPKHARFYFACVALGVDFLHRNGLLHCDIKPDNILICPSGYPVLADFGLIREVDTLVKDPQEWYVLGTSAFMCPEIHKESKTTPPRCSPTIIDWWAVGCTLYNMIGGNSPFVAEDDDTNEDIISRVVNREFPRSIDSLPSGPNCKDLISRFLHVDPLARIGATGIGLHEIQEHRWMQNISWDRLFSREYLAPLMMNTIPEVKQRHEHALPRKVRVPDLQIWTPPVHLAYRKPKAPKTPM